MIFERYSVPGYEKKIEPDSSAGGGGEIPTGSVGTITAGNITAFPPSLAHGGGGQRLAFQLSPKDKRSIPV